MTDSADRDATDPFCYHLSDDESLSEGVVEAVATASGRDPVPFGRSEGDAEGALDPLYTVVDPDALDVLFTGDARGEMTFVYHDYEVTADSSGCVSLARLEPVAGSAAD